MPTSSQKKYLLAIYQLSRCGQSVRSIDLAKMLAFSRASIVKMTNKLVEDGYIIKPLYQEITLTELGIKTANDLYTTKLIFHDFLTGVLKVDEKTAIKDAVALVCEMSDSTIENLVLFTINKAAPI